MPRTDAEYRAFKQAELHRAHQCDTCAAEVHAQGRAEALAAVRAAVLDDERVRMTHVDVDWVHLSAVLAAIDNLETKQEEKA